MATRVTDPELKARIQAARKRSTRQQAVTAPAEQPSAGLPFYPGGPELTGSFADVARGALRGPYTAFGMGDLSLGMFGAPSAPETLAGRAAQTGTEFASYGLGMTAPALRAAQLGVRAAIPGATQEGIAAQAARGMVAPTAAAPGATAALEAGAGLLSGPAYELARELVPSMPSETKIGGVPLWDPKDPIMGLAAFMAGAPLTSLSAWSKIPIVGKPADIARKTGRNIAESLYLQDRQAIRAVRDVIVQGGGDLDEFGKKAAAAPRYEQFPLDTGLATKEPSVIAMEKGSRVQEGFAIKGKQERQQAEAGALSELERTFVPAGEGGRDPVVELGNRVDHLRTMWQREINEAARKVNEAASFLPRDTNRIEVQQKAKAAIDESRLRWKEVEKSLWNTIDKKAEAPPATVQAILAAYERDQATEGFKGKAPSELVSMIQSWRNKLEAGEAITVGEVLRFRSDAHRALRNSVFGSPEAAVANNLQQTAIDSLIGSRGLPTDEIAKLDAARKYTAAYYQTFFEGPVGQFYRGKVSKQGLAARGYAAYTTLNKLWREGDEAQTVANLRAARAATMELAGGDPNSPQATELTTAFNDQVRAFVSDKLYTLSGLYRSGVGEAEGTIDVGRLRGWLQSHREVLKEIPGLEGELLTVIRAQEGADVTTGSRLAYQKFLDKTAAANFIRNPHAVLDGFIKGGDVPTMKGRVMPADEWVGSLKKTMSPQAWNGFRRMFYERLRAAMMSPRERGLSGDPQFAGQALSRLMDSPEHSKALQIIIGAEGPGGKRKMEVLRDLANVISRWDITTNDIPAIKLKPHSDLIVTVARIAGARMAGWFGQESAGGSLQNALIASQKMKAWLERFTTKYFDEAVYRLMHEPKLFAEVMEMTDKDITAVGHASLNAAMKPGTRTGDAFKAILQHPRTYNFLFGVMQDQVRSFEAESDVPLPPPPPGG